MPEPNEMEPEPEQERRLQVTINAWVFRDRLSEHSPAAPARVAQPRSVFPGQRVSFPSGLLDLDERVDIALHNALSGTESHPSGAETRRGRGRKGAHGELGPELAVEEHPKGRADGAHGHSHRRALGLRRHRKRAAAV